MTKVNQLLEKALSTQSEEEAISCLRLARKRHTGEPVTVQPTAAERSNAQHWREEAEKYFRAAQGYDKTAAIHRRLATEWMDKYTTESRHRQRLYSENKVLTYSVNIWRGLFVIQFLLTMLVIAI